MHKTVFRDVIYVLRFPINHNYVKIAYLQFVNVLFYQNVILLKNVIQKIVM